jgi:hypothetical protein
MDAMTPGFAAAFERNLGQITAAHARSLGALTPPATWSAHGAVLVGDDHVAVAASVANNQLALAISGVTLSMESTLDADEGFSRWAIACPAVLPACSPPTAPHAEFRVTRTATGYAGLIVVTSNVGQFPYRVDLGDAALDPQCCVRSWAPTSHYGL